MKPNLPSNPELDALALPVDDQLNDLRSQPASQVEVRGVAAGIQAKPPAAPKQQAVIETATGETVESFWEKFKRHTRRDLCLPGGFWGSSTAGKIQRLFGRTKEQKKQGKQIQSDRASPILCYFD